MSPRAAWRLEALGFEQVLDYVSGKADWLASGQGREGRAAEEVYAGDLVDPDPPTCTLGDRIADLAATLEGTQYGFALIVNDERILLGRVRRSALSKDQPAATVEEVLDPGPSTVRFDTPAARLIERLTAKGLHSAIVTSPTGRLLGVFHRADAERRLSTASLRGGVR